MVGKLKQKTLLTGVLVTLILLITSLTAVSAFDKIVYDNFETSNTINASQWLWGGPGGDPVINETIYHSSDQSAEMFGPSAMWTGTIPYITSGQYVFSFWNRAEQADGPLNDAYNPLVIQDNNAGLVCFYLDAGYPVTNNWGYYTGGSWHDTGVSAVEGVGNILHNWLNIQILLDNDNKLFSIRFNNETFNSTTDILTNISYGAGCDVANSFQNGLNIGGTQLYMDDVEIWNATTYGYTSPFLAPPPCIPSYNCTGYGSCQPNNQSACNVVFDTNSCGQDYDGNYSEFTPQICVYVPPTTPATLNNSGLLLLIVNVLIIFLIITFIDHLVTRKSPEMKKYFYYVYIFLALVIVVSLIGLLIIH